MVRLDRELDIVVYGATGFTGKLVAKHIAQNAGHIKLGLGGRSQEKLQQVADELGLKDPKIITADSNDASALTELCKKTKAVITLVRMFICRCTQDQELTRASPGRSVHLLRRRLDQGSRRDRHALL